MAKSPFPGMDPYLEQLWGDVHTRLVNAICDQVQQQLPASLVARMESRVLIEDESQQKHRERRPDVHVAADSRGGGTAVLESPPATASEPDLYLIEVSSEPETQPYIEIRDAESGGRVITTIELISPSNKHSGIGQELYLAKIDECRAARVNTVEIDLTRAGNRLALLPSLAQISPQPTYLAWVRRASRFDKVAVYVFPLDRPLRSMAVPLRAHDQDVILELQPLIEQAYQRGRYDRLDYTRPLDPPLTGEDAAVAEQLLKQTKT
jgi:hypothetical protein